MILTRNLAHVYLMNSNPSATAEECEMASPHPTELSRVIDSLESGEGGLRGFQSRLRDKGFPRAFANLLPTATLAEHLQEERLVPWEAIKGSELILMRIWSPLTEDEKVSSYVMDQKLAETGIRYDQLDLLAQVNFEIIGRHNTISERLADAVRHGFIGSLDGPILFELVHDRTLGEPFVFRENTDGLSFSIRYSTPLRDALGNATTSFHEQRSLPALFLEAVKGFLGTQTATKAGYPALARALRRVLHAEGQDLLLSSRRNALSLILEHDNSLTSLWNAVRLLGRAQPGVPDNALRHRSALVHYSDLFLEFLAVLQASIIFSPWYNHAIGLLISGQQKPPKSLCLVAVGSEPLDPESLKAAYSGAQAFLSQAVEVQQRLERVAELKSAHLISSVLGKDEPDAEIASLIRLGRTPEEMLPRFQRLQLLLRKIDQLKDAEATGTEEEFDRLRLGLAVIISALGELSRFTHEGLTGRFLALFGPGSCWRLFEETISRERGTENLSAIPLSNLLRSNYSIFQDPYAAAFIDTSVYPDGGAISYLGRLRERPDDEWLRRTTKGTLGLFALNASGDGSVRIYSGGRLVSKWNHEAATLVRYAPLDKKRLQIFFEEKLYQSGAVDELFEALMQIEETPGEGALVILGALDDVRAHLSPMETDRLQMAWASVASLEYVDRRILRALLRRDGASVIAPDGTMWLRKLVFPIDVEQRTAVQLNLDGDHDLGMELLGKGSRHFTARCLARVMNEGCVIIAVSVDGGMRVWSGEIKAAENGQATVA